MMPCERPEAPEILETNKETYTNEWVQKREAYKNSGAVTPKFTWYKMYDVIREKLGMMTEKHCSFCDSFPLGASGREEIEHLRPKADYPHEAYDWLNLYLCCSHCNDSKNNSYDTKVLRPDEKGFTFGRYFYCDGQGNLKPNPQANPEDQERASVTIALFKLDRDGLVETRMKSIRSPRGDYRFISSR